MGKSGDWTAADHLEAALEEIEDEEARFHIRQALQHLGRETE